MDEASLAAECESFGQILAEGLGAMSASPDEAEAISLEMLRLASEALTSESELADLARTGYETAREFVESGRSLAEEPPLVRSAAVICAEVGVSIDEIVADATVVESETPLTEIPAGFNDVNTGLAVRWLDRPDCGGHAYCQQLEFFTVERCDSGIYIEAQVIDRNGRVLGATNFEMGTLEQGRIGVATLAIEHSNYSHLELVEASCY